MKKIIAEIYFDDEMGSTTIGWNDNNLNSLNCFPTCLLDLNSDVVGEFNFKIKTLIESKEVNKK